MGFIFPAIDNGQPHVAALFGGAWLTPQILSDEALETFRQSIARFKTATARAGVDVLVQNHMLMDPIQPKLDALAARKTGEPRPFVVGAAGYQQSSTSWTAARASTLRGEEGSFVDSAPGAKYQGQPREPMSDRYRL
jgi:hypothetical protein